MQYEQFLNRVLSEASAIALRHFGTVSVSIKPEDNNQILTEADTEIGEFLVSECQRTYPEYNCIDEESGVIDSGSKYTWVIDPIDGTSNFANGLPHFGIMVGLLYEDQPIAGGIALPVFKQVYIAEKGKGAFRNGEQIAVSTDAKLLNALIAYGIDGHQEAPERTKQETDLLADIILAIRNLRTSNSAFDLCAVADGRYGALLNQTSKIWDNVAPHIIIEEAGGIYTAFDGKPINYSDSLRRVDDNFTVCAGAPLLHAQLQAIIHP